MNSAQLIRTLNQSPDSNSLWSDNYKIPWNDPAFSRRMLREHLSQEHELASRTTERIVAQAAWIRSHMEERGPAPEAKRLLDLGCGPGLYAPHLVDDHTEYLGLDFGPASIEHAQAHYARPGVEFRLADLTRTAFLDAGREPFDLALMLYGEINVFPPDLALAILRKAHDALAPGGSLLLEAHTEAAVRAMDTGRSWQAMESGLFSDRPHLCLTEGRWIEEQRTAVQVFHVLDGLLWPECARAATYRSTTRAYSEEEYRDLLHQAGFGGVEVRDDWPSGTEALLLLRASRS